MTDVISLPHYTQSSDGLCLAACARMVLAYWGESVSEEEVVALLGIRAWGVAASAIERLSQWGWCVDYGHGKPLNLAQWLERDIPVIVFIRTDFLLYWETDVGHALVVVGTSDEHVLVHDPVTEDGPLSISPIAFEAAWTEMDYSYAVVTPAPSPRLSRPHRRDPRGGEGVTRRGGEGARG